MNISKLKPIKLESEEQLKKVEAATKSQELRTSTPRTFDPNYQIFSFETNNKHLIYIPNFYTEVDGVKQLVVEKSFVHAINKGTSFMSLRSTHGLQGLEDLGISGESPLALATQECWELFNVKYQQFATLKGIDPKDDKGEVLKPKRIELLNQRVVKDADTRYYFPVVVFETEKDSKTGLNTFTFVLDTETQAPKYKIMWMDVSDNQWNEKWLKVNDSLDDGDCVAGKLLSLNYHFSDDISKEKNPRRDSGKALQINKRDIKPEHVEFFKYLDEEAKEWTPAKAREVIIACALLPDSEQQKIVDDLMVETRMELNQLKAMELGAGQQQQQLNTPSGQTPADALAGFGGVENEGGEDSNEPLRFGAK